MEKTKSLLILATAHVTQQTNNAVKTDYSLQANETNEVLFELPKCLTDSQVFSIMDFMKKYELKAFNIGINFQKTKNNKLLSQTINEQKNHITGLTNENARLAELLDNITKG